MVSVKYISPNTFGAADYDNDSAQKQTKSLTCLQYTLGFQVGILHPEVGDDSRDVTGNLLKAFKIQMMYGIGCLL